MAVFTRPRTSENATRGGRIATAALYAAALAVAVACSELLVVFLAPLAVLALAHTGWAGRRLWAVAAGVLTPGLVLAAASALARPPYAVLHETIARAQQAGLAVTDADENAISALGQSTRIGWTFVTQMYPTTVAQGLALFAGGYLLTTVAMASLLLPGVPARRLSVLVAGFAVPSLLLTVIGNDWKRWWALSFLALLAALPLMRDGAAGAAWRRRSGSILVTLVLAALAASVVLQYTPVWPSWDKRADTGFSLHKLAALDPMWVHGDG